MLAMEKWEKEDDLKSISDRLNEKKKDRQLF